jgi:cytochrome c1
MHLIYFDESGQTGTNLADPVQPVFVLGALVVPESLWLPLEKDLQAAIDKHFPAPRPDDFEIHATEISNARKSYFKQFPVAHRLAFRDDWFRI